MSTDTKELRAEIRGLDIFGYARKGESVFVNVDDIVALIAAQEVEARINERKQVALDNYRGQTFSESTNYQAKFEKFMRNNELVIKRLKSKGEDQ